MSMLHIVGNKTQCKFYRCIKGIEKLLKLLLVSWLSSLPDWKVCLLSILPDWKGCSYVNSFIGTFYLSIIQFQIAGVLCLTCAFRLVGMVCYMYMHLIQYVLAGAFRSAGMVPNAYILLI